MRGIDSANTVNRRCAAPSSRPTRCARRAANTSRAISWKSRACRPHSTMHIRDSDSPHAARSAATYSGTWHRTRAVVVPTIRCAASLPPSRRRNRAERSGFRATIQQKTRGVRGSFFLLEWSLLVGIGLLGEEQFLAGLSAEVERLHTMPFVVVLIVRKLVDDVLEMHAHHADVLVAVVTAALPRGGRSAGPRHHRRDGCRCHGGCGER